MHLNGMACLFTLVQGPSTSACHSKHHDTQLYDLVLLTSTPFRTKTLNPAATEPRVKAADVLICIGSYPVLINDIYDGHQFAFMGTEGDVGDAADFDEALEHLVKTGNAIKVTEICYRPSFIYDT